MLRSFIDRRVEAMLEFCERCGFKLPPFALWSGQDFRAAPDAAKRIAENGLGWNIVEFKRGAFARDGLSVFTLRMGDWRRLKSGAGRLYSEKALYAEDGQRTPHHYHVVKTEDILNRGGARFVVELFKVDRAGRRLDERVRIMKDAAMIEVAAGGRVVLEPGESLVLEPYVAHAFWAEGGAALAGEVSLANDDATDNYFLSAPEPPAPIEEDAPMRHPTVRDYAALILPREAGEGDHAKHGGGGSGG
ncbi:MAG TPA: D-lyxose/D-mannose family sugar isomerase [Roseiarcus sp.]|nr:D-lyxose/D-mannose family sugar isomerase [Roseiarcus sp.]